MRIAIPRVAVIIISLINYVMPYNDNIKGILFGIIPGTVITSLFYVDGYAINKHYLIFTSIAMVALYFQKRFIIIYTFTLNVLMTAVYCLNPKSVTGPSETGIDDFISIIVILDSVSILLYFLSKWVRKLLDESIEREAETKNLLEKLQTTFTKIEESAGLLESNMTSLNNNINTIGESSNNITLSIQEMSQSIQIEASCASKVNETMVNSIGIAHETMEISRGVINNTEQISQRLKKDGLKWSK